jgi:hypothetical protein
MLKIKKKYFNIFQVKYFKKKIVYNNTKYKNNTTINNHWINFNNDLDCLSHTSGPNHFFL